MKIALAGYGKMGKLIATIAAAKNHVVSDSIAAADVLIDFSHPDAVLENIERAAALQKKIVVGTTGWYHQLSEAEKIVKKYRTALIYSPNFSLGVNLFLQVVQEAAKLIGPFSDYDVSCMEVHHKHKADLPSGTAQALGKILLDNIKRKTALVSDLGGRAVGAEEIHVSATRCGDEPGTHTVRFDSAVDTITLTHSARCREGFALGALAAAEWIQDKTGFFTLQDMLQQG